jgi:serine/threonine protein phosphatase PrpC
MCGTKFTYLGWRNYMEDAHISVSPLSDKRSSLFAVFDGHGGNIFTNNYRR